MAKPLVSDALWKRIEPMLPSPPPRRTRFPGRKPLEYRKILTGIVFVLKTGINWEDLPAELGWGCGKSCKNYLRAWQQAGIWTRVHPILLEELLEADRIDWSRGAAHAAKVRCLGGGTGLEPEQRGDLATDRGTPTTVGTGADATGRRPLRCPMDGNPGLSAESAEEPALPEHR